MPLQVEASAVALSALVTMEMLRALCAVSETESLLTKPPWANQWLIVGVSLPMLLHLTVLYVEPLAKLFELAPLTLSDWQTVSTRAAPHTVLLVPNPTSRPSPGCRVRAALFSESSCDGCVHPTPSFGCAALRRCSRLRCHSSLWRSASSTLRDR